MRIWTILARFAMIRDRFLATQQPTSDEMSELGRITFDPNVMGGKPCIRGMRVTVGTIVGLIAVGATAEEILIDYPYIEAEDISAALSYAAWRSEEIEVPLARP
jgi:uncharacterized protein (DUF433 family)